jgi:hypothetical protein
MQIDLPVVWAAGRTFADEYLKAHACPPRLHKTPRSSARPRCQGPHLTP